MAWDKTSEKLLNEIIQSSLRTGNTATVLRLIQKHRLLENVNKVLSIGAGSGTTELELLKNFPIQIGYIDPSESLAQKFFSEADALGFSEQVSDRHVGPFHSFKESFKYDFVMAIHSWYYISTEKESLDRLRELLTENGKALVLLTSKTDFTQILMAEFSSGLTSFKGESFRDALDKTSIPYDLDEFCEPVKFNRCFNNDSFSDFGKKWSSYFLGTPFEEHSVDMQKRLYDFFKIHQEKNTPHAYQAYLIHR